MRPGLCVRLRVAISFALLMYLSLVHLMLLSFCPSDHGLIWEYLSFFITYYICLILF